MIITIDPGKTTGWAIFLREGELVQCGYGSSDKFLKKAPWWQHLADIDVVLVEVPVLYHSEKEPNPNMVLRNGVLAGRYLQQAVDGGAQQVEEVSPPRIWKGTIAKPKPGQQYGIEKRVFRVLTTQEGQLIKATKSARAKSINHNLIDAVGMGLWWLERRGKRRWKY